MDKVDSFYACNVYHEIVLGLKLMQVVAQLIYMQSKPSVIL